MLSVFTDNVFMLEPIVFKESHGRLSALKPQNRLFPHIPPCLHRLYEESSNPSGEQES